MSEPSGNTPQSTTPVGTLASSNAPAIARERLQFLTSVVRDIDHTILKQDATDSDVAAICDEALKARALLGVGPKSVCVNSSDVKFCADRLGDSGILVCSVVGFPLGRMTTDAKVYETRAALREGAREIDMVINVGALRSGRTDFVESDIAPLVRACNDHGAILKVIIEACNLDDAQKIAACQASVRAGAHFVKTSTGMQKGGATLADVRLMYDTVKGNNVLVKAAGGISTVDDALAMREAGAARFGSSALLKAIIRELETSTESVPSSPAPGATAGDY